MHDEEDKLQLSGIQHFLFCRKQWALIHIEQQWNENEHTTLGNVLHERVHDTAVIESSPNRFAIHGMRVTSNVLGAVGDCDLVEFIRSDDGISVRYKAGNWKPTPVEFKKGSHDYNEADAAQLCAQAMCLEEMLCCSIESGYLFWKETHRREEIIFTEELRHKVKDAFKEMHAYFDRQYTPQVKKNNQM